MCHIKCQLSLTKTTVRSFEITVEPEFNNHPFCQAKVVINARWLLKKGSDAT